VFVIGSVILIHSGLAPVTTAIGYWFF